MEEKDRINLVIKAMKKVHVGGKGLKADGTVGKQAATAAGSLLLNRYPSHVNDQVIIALKQAGFNNKLEADGEIGIQAIKAIGKFLALAGN